MSMLRKLLGLLTYVLSLIVTKALTIFIVAFLTLVMTLASFTIPALANLASGLAAAMFGRTAVLTVSETRSIREQNRRLHQQNSRLQASNNELSSRNHQLSENNRHLERQAVRQRGEVARHADRIKKRSTRQTARSISAIPAESIPVIGVTTIIATTAWDISDTCRLLQDMSEIQRSLGDEPDETMAETICGRLSLQTARAEIYGNMTVSQCREEADQARDRVFDLAKSTREGIPDLITDISEFDEEIMEIAREEHDSINLICDCIEDLACDLDDFARR